MNMISRTFFIILIGFATAAPALAQEWPAKAVRFVVPFPAGGATDLLTRVLCQQLEAQFNVPFVVENRGGAGGNLGARRSRVPRLTVIPS